MIQTLSRRELNRATLARQLLLERHALDPVDAIQRVAGLQAQEPASPYIALWSRLEGFEARDLDQALIDRRIVKATLLRLTLHLVSGRDYLDFRAAMDPTLKRGHSGDPRWRAGAPRIDEWTQAALAYTAQPRSNTEMRAFLSDLAGADLADDLWWTLRWHAPFIHAPSPVTWSFGRRPIHASATAWLGRELPTPQQGLAHLVTRYLAAFGPASVADIARWAGIERSRIREGLAAVAGIRKFRDEDGRDLLDLEGAPLPSPEAPAPARFLPMWDSAVLAFDDRRRILPEAFRAEVIKRNGDFLPTILVDGVVGGIWRADPTADGTRIRWRSFERLPPDAEAELTAEAARLETFLAPLDRSVYSFYRRWHREADEFAGAG